MNTRSLKILCLLFIGILFLAPTMARAVPTLAPTYKITSVPVPNSTDYVNNPTLAYDSGKGEVFAQYNTETGTAVVAVISDSTNKVIANITEAQGAAQGYIGDLVYDSGKGEVFAAYGSSSSAALASGSSPLISVISDSNNTAKTISWNTPGNSQYNWPATPTGMAYDSGKGEIFISSGYVYVMSDSNDVITATIQTDGQAGEMVYDSAKGEVFVANSGIGYYGGYSPTTISVISDTTNKVVANISASATSLAYDPAKGEVFAYNGSAISVISDSTNTVIATITGISGGSGSIAYDSGKGEIFAGAVLSDSTNSVVALLPTGIQNTVYDSSKGEIFGVYVPTYYSEGPGIDVFSDSSSATLTTSSSGSATSSSSATTTSATSVSQSTHPTSSTTSSSSSSSSISLSLSYLTVVAAVAAMTLAVTLTASTRRHKAQF